MDGETWFTGTLEERSEIFAEYGVRRDDLPTEIRYFIRAETEEAEQSKPAFPRPNTIQEKYGPVGERLDDVILCGSPGMTLREYYAGLAMQGILAAQIHGFNDQPSNGPFACMSVQMADALIAELQQEAENE
jgi:hypothetical protein